jgi:deoxycytidylate deaminase
MMAMRGGAMGRPVQKLPQVGRQSAAVNPQQKDSRALVRTHASNELIFAVVGPVGSGTSEVCDTLQELLKSKGYTATILKARAVIEEWITKRGQDLPTSATIANVIALQDAGDELRKSTNDNAAVALRLIEQIRAERARQKGESVVAGEPVDPDGSQRAFILDSLRNPAEAGLLRAVYQDAFCLIGVVCSDDVRKERLRSKFGDAGNEAIESFMKRDQRADEKHGQQVSETFHLSDFFLDNTAARYSTLKGGATTTNKFWNIPEELGRLVDIYSSAKIVRPRPNETAMFHAYGAKMRSACLSRQVGAALMDKEGNVISTGTNEVPRAGGGVYGGSFIDSSDVDPAPDHDHRCFHHGKYCRNTREQNEIINELLKGVPEFSKIPTSDALIKSIRSTRIGQLIEFSRAVHAEMEALLSAARQGITTRGTRLFVTTFPCHSCARHIVAAGVDEVQFIEPYLKSQALPLHGAAITTVRKDWTPPSVVVSQPSREDTPQVLFRPFTGVSPRLYRRAFFKDHDLKDGLTGDLLKTFPPRDGMGSSETLRISYAQMEAHLAQAAKEASP